MTSTSSTSDDKHVETESKPHAFDAVLYQKKLLLPRRHQYMQVLSPSRTAVAYYRVDEEAERRAAEESHASPAIA